MTDTNKTIDPLKDVNRFKDNSVPDMETKENTSNEVTVPASLLERMQEEIKELKKNQNELSQQKDKEEKPEEKKENAVLLRKYEGQLVLGFDKKKGTWQKYDEKRRVDRLMMDIIVLNENGKEIPVTVDYMKFMENTPTVKVPLLSVSSKPIVKELGYIKVKEVIDYKTIDTPNKIMQKVLSTADTATIRLPDGSKRELDMDFINM